MLMLCIYEYVGMNLNIKKTIILKKENVMLMENFIYTPCSLVAEYMPL